MVLVQHPRYYGDSSLKAHLVGFVGTHPRYYMDSSLHDLR